MGNHNALITVGKSFAGTYAYDKPLLTGFGASLPSGPWIGTIGCTRWQQTQWKAMFNGIPFAVAADERSGGRRIHVHEFPAREIWINEDLGRLRQMVEVEAYVFGDRSDLWAEILFAACDSGVVGWLYLPMRVPYLARMIAISSRFSEEALGRLDFTIRFVLEPMDPDLALVPTAVGKWKSPTFLAQSVANAAREVTEQARYDFEVSFTGDQAATGRVQAAQMINLSAAALRKSYKQARVALLQASKVDFAIRRMQLLSVELADSQRTSSDTLSSTVLIRTQKIGRASHLQAVKAGLKIPPNPLSGLAMRASTDQVIDAIGKADEGFGGTFLNALTTLALGAPDPTDLVQALNVLIATNTTALKTSVQTSAAASIATDLELAATVGDFVRRAAIAAQALATIKVAPEDQAGAVKTRARLLNTIDTEIASLLNKQDMTDAMRSLRRNIVDYSAFWSAGGAATKLIKSKTVLPLAVVAANNYPRNKVEERDREMMKLNSVRHPLFAPAELSALRE